MGYQYSLNGKTFGASGNASLPSGATLVSGSPDNSQQIVNKTLTSPDSQSPIAPTAPTAPKNAVVNPPIQPVQSPVQNQQPQQSPVPQTPIINPPQSPVTPGNQNQIATADQTAQKYQSSFQTVSQNKNVPQTAGAAGAVIQQTTSQYQPQPTPYQPTPSFMTVGDPIMQSFVQAALGYQQEVVDTGYTSKYLQATLGNDVKGLDLQAANIQNIMNGTRDDIRAEIGKAGGFATESQVEGLVTTRNRDLLKQYNNIELQKQTMQNQMNLQVQLAQADHQYALDKFNGVLQTHTLYKGIYDNFTDQLDKKFTAGGYQALADISQGNPYYQSLIEQHLQLPQGTLGDPSQVQKLQNDTYKNQSLALQNARFSANYGYNAPSTQNGTPSIGNGTGNGTPTPSAGGSSNTNNGVSYTQYGLLSKTDFNPTNSTDKSAYDYLSKALNGSLPTKASDIGISVRGAGAGTQFNNAKSRAESLYLAATGQNMPSPDIIKNNLKLINDNNTLANKLNTQELTVASNIDLSLSNMTKNGLNSSNFAPLNKLIDYSKNLFNDPAVGQLISQNTTIQNELGSLLAVKNASGTTVYDKLSSAGIISPSDTPQNIQRKVSTMIQEANNFKRAITQVNGDLYKTIDPFERLSANPNRFSKTNSGKSFDYAKAKKDNPKLTDQQIEDFLNKN